MATGFNTQCGSGEYRLQFETDCKEKFEYMQEAARKCVDGKEDPLFEALENIIWYDGHYEWLMKLRDDMQAHIGDRIYENPFPTEQWHTEGHTIWMLLVGMFGDWGTSIRSGWIDNIQGCIRFIDAVCATARCAEALREEIEGSEEDGKGD